MLGTLEYGRSAVEELYALLTPHTHTPRFYVHRLRHLTLLSDRLLERPNLARDEE